jgi:hypothetical protein
MAQRFTIAIPGPQGQDINVGSGSASGTVGLPVSQAPSSASTVKTVQDSASSVTLAAANPNRRGVVITNTSSAILYVRMASGTASETMFTYRLPQNATQEVLFPYTGMITGMWASDNNDGVATITEFTT